MAVRIKYDARKLKKALKKLEDKVTKKIIRQALREGAKIMAKEMRARVPVVTGKLKAAIKIWTMKRRKNRIGLMTGPSNRSYEAGKYPAAAVEYGTKDQPAKPFMGPSVEAKGSEAAAAIEKKLIEGIEREAGRLK